MHWERPRLDGKEFEKISRENNIMLIDIFEEQETKETIWDCGNSKSSDPGWL